ncbi:glycoside hydrolase family 13 protein [Paenisporosarcina cavernae]|uniref:oligo-1,6-glucosidase n=1 Tax=Paenisporosarcina cavernae TaxID=2320858 RepID=A0A385YWU3_9BACL|nr:alpha-glucosidase [Paenisporosarcina cavernae]AYC30740.1 alpha-glucosidase [Paenisporosarcina cavernae]
MESNWWKKSVVYQIYPRSFNDSNGDGIGDLPGIIEKLDYLQKLGIDVLWLSPIFDSPNDDNGYDIRNYETIMDEFGTMEDVELLISEAKKRGIHLVMDLVVNHTSDEHEWFAEAKKSKDNAYRDYYIWREGEGSNPPNNWGSFFSGSAWEWNEPTQDYYLHLFSKKQPDLNWESDSLRKAVYEMMHFWLNKGVAGFRMDVINLISKHPALPNGPVHPGQLFGDGSPYYMNGPKIHDYMQEMHQEVLSRGDILTVGECPGATTEDAALFSDPNRNELSMIFTFEHMSLDSGPYEKWDLRALHLPKLKKNFRKWQTELHGKGWNSLYWNNHDQPRIVSRFGNDTDYRVESAKMLATCLHFMQGTPYIYQGEEIGMTNVVFESIEDYQDLETRRMYDEKMANGAVHEDVMQSIYVKGRDNARTPMQWDDTAEAGFTTGTPWLKVNPNYKTINVQEALASPNSIFAYYQSLIQLRKELDILTEGSFVLLLPDDEEIFAYQRHWQEEMLTVYCNFSASTRDISCVHENESDVVIKNYETLEWHDNTLTLRPFEAVIFKFNKNA